MRDTDQIIAIREVMVPIMGAGVRIVQGYPPDTAAQPSQPTISLYAISAVDYGSPSRSAVWNEEAQSFDYEEQQVVETTWQANAIVVDATDDMDSDTLLRKFRMSLRSQPVLEALRRNGLALYRPRDIRKNPIAESDGGNPEMVNSFDFVVQHTDILKSATEAVTSYDVAVHRV